MDAILQAPTLLQLNLCGFQGANGEPPRLPISVPPINWWWVKVTNDSLSKYIVQVDPKTSSQSGTIYILAQSKLHLDDIDVVVELATGMMHNK